MKTFYTSNYAKSGTDPKAVAISEKALVPADYAGVRSTSLAPTHQLLADYHGGTLDNPTYADLYLELLGKRGVTPQTIADRFEDGTIFVCFDYEDGDIEDGVVNVCHRVILADWLNKSGLATVTEIEADEPLRATS